MDYDYATRLLDEMAEHGMNLLSIMMQSYGYFDPQHDGYAWPVQNPKLRPYRDSHAINADEKTEFLSKAIEYAKQRHIQIELFLNWGIWNPNKLDQSKGSNLQLSKSKKYGGWLHCPDSPIAWQFGLDEMTDLLTYYPQRNVTRFGFERISYSGSNYCVCPYTQAKFLEQMHKSINNSREKEWKDWRIRNIAKKITEYTAEIHKTRPDLQIDAHARGSSEWGHDPHLYSSCGVAAIQPHTIQFKSSKREIYSVLDYLAPNPCISHFDARDVAPANYPIWIKTPKIIRTVLQWLADYPKPHLNGIIFFNEPTVSPQNKQAVYTSLEQLFTL